MSYVFMTLLRFRAAILVKAGVVLLTLGPLITGLYYIYAWRPGPIPAIEKKIIK